MRIENLRKRMLARENLAGTFIRTPAPILIELLARTSLDFVCLDAEHAPFGRPEIDACVAAGRNLDFPVLVRIPAARPEYVLQALDCGAAGIVVPHVDTLAQAEEISRAARYGPGGGRGFAGGTRWAISGEPGMAAMLERSKSETIVLAQIEEPSALNDVEAMAALPGIDGLFVGPSDLSVAYGTLDQNSQEIRDAFARVDAATRAAGKANVTFVNGQADIQSKSEMGIHVFLIGSDQTWMMRGANEDVKIVEGLS